LRPEYEQRIRQLEQEGRAKRFNVQLIFTEDSHPGLTGVSSIVFPQLSDVLSDLRSSPVAVGFWHLEVAARKDKLNLPYTKTHGVISAAINRRVMNFVDKGFHNAEEFINSGERDYLKELHQIGDTSNRDLAKAFIRPVLERSCMQGGINAIDVSRSYVMAATLKDGLVADIARAIRSRAMDR
jgi:hypothetical protein